MREPEGTQSDFARFEAEGITFHVEKRLLSALPPEGGEIRCAMGEYGTTTIELRPSP